MKRKERRQEFHDSLLNMLYAPPPPHHEESESDEQILDLAREITNPDHPINTNELEREEERRSSSPTGDEDELGSHKLTRAQRKRLRKKKLKEAGSHRRKIIGPQLPSTSTSDDQVNGEDDDVTACEQRQSVRQNAAEEIEGKTDHDHDYGLEAASCTKVKLRRMFKKQARETPKAPPTDFSTKGTRPSDHDETSCRSESFPCLENTPSLQ